MNPLSLLTPVGIRMAAATNQLGLAEDFAAAFSWAEDTSSL